MGCNVADVKYVVVFGCPESFAAVAQRWGRAGRNSTIEAVCLLLVPPWAFSAEALAVVNDALQRVQGRPKAVGDTKQALLRRSKLDPKLEAFINITPQSPIRESIIYLLRPLLT